ncbi:hypothetical protein SAMN05216304_1024 [Bosea sp. OK403]|uniref:Imm50 family immunity protein n=1 Tax=Bosea sp. OK403 TaxID=1855286 RepID=UPI0008EE2B2A|nr:Imm50 family immunity protein [Bosea sp. OK403]SFI26320.1 hypothetical protein SAMN05216304_1024 [Bosea sp. OK403]
MKKDESEELSLWSELPGGNEIISWFGAVPDFHDAEIVGLKLDRGGPSRLDVYFFRLQQSPMFKPNVLEPTGDAIITFEFDHIVDLSLEGFSPQNVIFGLRLGRAKPNPERAPYFGIDSSPDDYEIELDPCYGLSGKIRARSVRLSLVSGRPEPLRPVGSLPPSKPEAGAGAGST